MRSWERVRSGRWVATALGAVVLATVGCSDDDEIDDIIGVVRTYDVAYSATVGGASTLDSITYLDGDGNEVTVSDPPDGWTQQILALAGDPVSLRASGTVDNGEISVSIAGEDGFGGTVDESDSCVDLTGSQGCELSIPAVVLP